MPLVRAYQNGGIDGKDLRRAAKLLDDSNDEYLYDSDISTQELVKIDTKGGDLSKTGMVVKDSHDVLARENHLSKSSRTEISSKN